MIYLIYHMDTFSIEINYLFLDRILPHHMIYWTVYVSDTQMLIHFSGNFSWNLSIIFLDVSRSLIVFSQFPSPPIQLLWFSLNWNVVSRFAFWQFPNFTNISHFYDDYDTYWSLRFLIAWSCSRSPTALQF